MHASLPARDRFPGDVELESEADLSEEEASPDATQLLSVQSVTIVSSVTGD